MSDNSAITTINGTDLLLLVETATGEWQPIAHATAHSLEITRNTRSISSKSTGDADIVEYGKYTWSGSADALMTFSSGVINYNELVDKQIDRELIKVISVINTPLGTSVADLANTVLDNPLDADKADYDPLATALADTADNPFKTGTTYREGTAIIASISMTATDGETVTFSMSFTGASALTKDTVATVLGT